MIKEDSKYKFQLELGKLSPKARDILNSFGLLDFDTFYYWIFVQREQINFLDVRRCGYKTKDEIDGFIRIMTSLETIDDHLWSKYEEAFLNLSVRSRNILMGLGLINYDLFHDYYFVQQKRIDFRKVRNCGVKSKEELDKFFSKIIEFKKGESSIIEPHIYRLKLLQNNPIIPSDVDFKAILLFEDEFNKLSVRARNILNKLDANTIDGFHNNVLFADPNAFISLRNCGRNTLQEILVFKIVFQNIIKQSKRTASRNLNFSNLELYINSSACLKPIETEIFRSYYGFIRNEKTVRRTELADRYKFSRERVRQITKLLPQQIEEIINTLIYRYKLSFHQYFTSQCFVVNKEFADIINQNESTDYSTKFISFVLSITCPKEYSFYSFNSENLSEHVIFIHKEIPIDVVGLFQYLKRIGSSYKISRSRISLDELLHIFRKESQSTNFSEFSGKEGLIKMLYIFIKYEHNEKIIIEIDGDYLLIKHKNKELLFDIVYEILNEHNRPMHYSDIYIECRKRRLRPTTESSVHGTLIKRPDIFGLKGPGYYGLIEWGGFFGSIGDVAEKILEERNEPILKQELDNIISRELYISKDSIKTILFDYDLEKRFIKINDNKISLRKWIKGYENESK